MRPQKTSKHYIPQNKHSTWQKTSSNPKTHQCFKCYVSQLVSGRVMWTAKLPILERHSSSELLSHVSGAHGQFVGFSRGFFLCILFQIGKKNVVWLIKKEWWCKSCHRGSYWVENQDTVICRVGMMIWQFQHPIRNDLFIVGWEVLEKKTNFNRRFKAFLFTYFCKGLDSRQNKSIMKECGKLWVSIAGIFFYFVNEHSNGTLTTFSCISYERSGFSSQQCWGNTGVLPTILVSPGNQSKKHQVDRRSHDTSMTMEKPPFEDVCLI